jgi:hypothetical protein
MTNDVFYSINNLHFLCVHDERARLEPRAKRRFLRVLLVHTLQLRRSSHAPSKVKFFGWLLALDRVPTRMSLLKKNIMEPP